MQGRRAAYRPARFRWPFGGAGGRHSTDPKWLQSKEKLMDPDETIRRMRELAAALTGPGLRTNAERARLGADLADQVEALDGWLSRGGVRPQAWIRPGEPHTVTITREQLENWAGRALADDEVDTLDSCIPDSSIPEAIATIAAHALTRSGHED
jgi:hypothetical protein